MTIVPRVPLFRGFTRVTSITDVSSTWRCSRHLFPTTSNLSQPRRTLLTLSEVSGPLHPPLLLHTLPEYFATEILPQYADHPALICKQEKANAYTGITSTTSGDLRWTFEEMDKHIEALSKGMIAMGVQKGDRVGVVLGNCRFVLLPSFYTLCLIIASAYALLQWACARIGAVIVTINPAYRMHELVGSAIFLRWHSKRAFR